MTVIKHAIMFLVLLAVTTIVFDLGKSDAISAFIIEHSRGDLIKLRAFSLMLMAWSVFVSVRCWKEQTPTEHSQFRSMYILASGFCAVVVALVFLP